MTRHSVSKEVQICVTSKNRHSLITESMFDMPKNQEHHTIGCWSWDFEMLAGHLCCYKLADMYSFLNELRASWGIGGRAYLPLCPPVVPLKGSSVGILKRCTKHHDFGIEPTVKLEAWLWTTSVLLLVCLFDFWAVRSRLIGDFKSQGSFYPMITGYFFEWVNTKVGHLQPI